MIGIAFTQFVAVVKGKFSQEMIRMVTELAEISGQPVRCTLHRP